MHTASITDYIKKAIQYTTYEYSEETKDGCAYVPQLPGCWAQSQTVEETRSELMEVIEGWLILALQFNDPIPDHKVGIQSDDNNSFANDSGL
jgi:predicted RNase H-like HicB family nuclease